MDAERGLATPHLSGHRRRRIQQTEQPPAPGQTRGHDSPDRRQWIKVRPENQSEHTPVRSQPTRLGARLRALRHHRCCVRSPRHDPHHAQAPCCIPFVVNPNFPDRLLSDRQQSPSCSNCLTAGHLQVCKTIDSKEKELSISRYQQHQHEPSFRNPKVSATPSGRTSLSGQYEGGFGRFYASVRKGNIAILNCQRHLSPGDTFS